MLIIKYLLLFLEKRQMKTYKLLWHVFQMEDRAYSFLESYVNRIDTYANEKGISKDILEDIKYNIIEKLYTSPTPIKEAFVMNLAENIWEPEAIFDWRDMGEMWENSEPSNLFQRWFGTNKPQIWWVCYWIAKSANIPVMWVRLFFLIAIPFWGLSVWVYPVLALFVPFKDKGQTTWKNWNLFFELVRIGLWLMILFTLGGLFLWGVMAITLFSSFPTISGQVVQWVIPRFYPVAWVGMVALSILLIASLGALFKQQWFRKWIILTALVTLLLSWVIGGILGANQWLQILGTNHIEHKTQLLSNEKIDWKNLKITVDSDVKRYLSPLGTYGGWFFGIEGRFWRAEHIQFIASENDTISAWVETEFLPINENPETIVSKLSPVQSKFDKENSELSIHFPTQMFSSLVPFVGAQRRVVISVPKDMIINYKNSTLGLSDNISSRYSIDMKDSGWYECLNKDVLFFETNSNRRVCKDTIPRVVEPQYPSSEDQITTDDQAQGIASGDSIQNTETPQILPAWVANQATQAMQQAQPSAQDNRALTNTAPVYYNPNYYDYADAKEREAERVYIGKTLAAAQALAKQRGETIRVTEQDDIDMPPATDFVPGRIKAELRNGIIIDVDIEGEKQLNQATAQQARAAAPTVNTAAQTPRQKSNTTTAPQNSAPVVQNPTPQVQNTQNLSPKAREYAAERAYLGKTLAEAQSLARQRGETIRVTEQDDIDMPPARDFVLGRVKVELKRGIITEVDLEGYDD